MATRSLAGSIVSFPCPTSLPGHSNLLECNPGKHLVPTTGREIDLPINFLLYLIRHQGLPPPASFSVDRSPPINPYRPLLQAPLIGRFASRDQDPLVLGRYLSQDLVDNLSVRHKTRPRTVFDVPQTRVFYTGIIWLLRRILTLSNINVISEKPNCITIPYMVTGVNGRDLQYRSILILLDGDEKPVTE
jgi:hypothetical protein